jgi:hypothetical protein
MAVRLLPDVEILAVAHLKAAAEIVALVGDRVGGELYAGDSPAVWLSYVTGDERFRNHLAAPMLDVRSYGGTKAQASTLARTVHAVMHDLPGAHAQGVVTAVQAVTLPFWSPDEGFNPHRARYVGSYVITLHPNPS